MSDQISQDLEQLADAAAKKAVIELLEKLGVDAKNILESQKDFAHLRRQRLASEQIGKLAVRTILTIFVTGLCSVFLLGMKDFFKH